MTVNPPLVTLGGKRNHRSRSRLSLISSNFPFADKKAGEEASHHRGHVQANRLLQSARNRIDQFYEFLPAIRASFLSRFEGRGLPPLMSLTYSPDCLLCGLGFVETSVDAVGQAAGVAFLRTPFFLVQVPLDRCPDFIQSFSHSQAGRMQWSSLIVVKEYHALPQQYSSTTAPRGISVRSRRVRRPGDHRYSGFRIIFRNAFRRPPAACCSSTACLIFPQTANLLPHLEPLAWLSASNTGLATSREEMVVAVAMRHVGKLRSDPRHERVLLVRQPQPHRLAQRFGPLFGLGDQASNLGRGRGDQGLGEPHPLLG